MNSYQDPSWVEDALASGRHREIIGGLWDELGALQRDFLVRQGLRPEHRLIDIGCGSLRAGVKLIPYLGANYFGLDLLPELIEAGRRELGVAGLELPQENLWSTPDFEMRGLFDYGIAQSVFTHLPLKEFSRCLDVAAPHFHAGGRLFVTVFEGEAAEVRHPRGVVTFADRDPYHAPRERILAAVTPAWRARWIGEWGHPRDQQMLELIRVPSPETRLA
jgi:SAM-dependent methyltransferase